MERISRYVFLFLSVKASKEESKEQSNNLKEEVIARLEKTSADIAEVEGRTETSIGAVYGNIETTEEKHAVSIAQLSDSLVVSSVDISTYHRPISSVDICRAWSRK